MEEQQVQDNNKVAKEFENNLKKLIALMGGEKNMRKPNVPKDDIGKLVEELIKERREEKIQQFKKDAKGLLDKKMEFDKECKKLEEEYKKTVLNKKKEFSEEMKKVFNIVEDINEIEKNYYETLNATKGE